MLGKGFNRFTKSWEEPYVIVAYQSAHSDCEHDLISDGRLGNKPKLGLKKHGRSSDGVSSQDPNCPSEGCLGTEGIVGGVP